MIVDTSALIAILREEEGSEKLLDACASFEGFIIAPVVVEFERVSSLAANKPDPAAEALMNRLLGNKQTTIPFTQAHALEAKAANALYGSGNGLGGKLNMLDLMVYGAAKALALPILCTGRDFALTDALLHSASRLT